MGKLKRFLPFLAALLLAGLPAKPSPAAVAGVVSSVKKLVYNVKDFGVRGNGTTNDTTALQTLIGNAAAGSKLYFPDGRYKLDRISITKILTLEGAGAGGTFLVPNSDEDFLKLNVAGGSQVTTIRVANLSIFPTTNRTAGAAIRLGYVGFCTFENLRIGSSLGGKPWEGVRVDRASDCAFRNVRVSGIGANGTNEAAVVYQPSGASSVIVGVDWDDMSQIRSGDGDGLLMIQDYASSGASIEGNHFNGTTFYNNTGAAIRIKPNHASAIITGTHLNNCIIDTNAGGGIITDAGGIGGNVRRLNVDGGWLSNNTGYGAYFSAQVQDSKITNCNVTKNTLDGIRIDGSKNIDLFGLMDYNNSQASTGVSYGVYLTGTATFVRLKVSSLYNSTDFTAKQNGLYIDSTVTDVEAESLNLYVLTSQTALTQNSTTRVRLFGVKVSNSGIIAATVWPDFFNAAPDETNFEKLGVSYAGGIFTIAATSGGTGSNRSLRLQSGTAQSLSLCGNGTSACWNVPSSGGTVGPASDLAFNIGAQASARPGNIWGGGFGRNMQAKTATYTLTTTDGGAFCNTTTVSSFTITLPTAVGIGGREYYIFQVGNTNTLTIATTSAQTINGASTKTLTTQYSGLRLVSDGANWIATTLTAA